MSDTPKTDAVELIYGGIVASGYADAEICRKLERECNDLREQLYFAVEMLSTHPQFENKHPEEVWAIVKEAAK